MSLNIPELHSVALMWKTWWAVRSVTRDCCWSESLAKLPINIASKSCLFHRNLLLVCYSAEKDMIHYPLSIPSQFPKIFFFLLYVFCGVSSSIKKNAILSHHLIALLELVERTFYGHVATPILNI